MTASTRITHVLLVLVLVAALAVVAMLATTARGGPLDPPGPPASTQAMLISQPASCAGFPIVISNPGSYRLASNIVGCDGKSGISITSDNVSLDLGGFSLMGTGSSGTLVYGIEASSSGTSQVRIANGTVSGWRNGGTQLLGTTTSRIDDVIAAYNGGSGITLGTTSTVTNSTASANGTHGIVASSGATIAHCVAEYNGGDGVQSLGAGAYIDDCKASSNTGLGFNLGDAARVTRNHANNNGAGIVAGANCTIEGNSVVYNSGTGITGGERCAVRGNVASSNAFNGLAVVGSYSVVERNHADANTTSGIAVSTAAIGAPGIIISNTATGNLLQNYSLGANLDAGPIVSAAFATNPTSNISN